MYLWKYLLLLSFIFFKPLMAFDNGGNSGDSNGNCPGETISLPITGPSPFVGNGNVHGDDGDWADRFKFTIPLSGKVKIILSSNTDLDFKAGTYCGGQNLIRYADKHTNYKVFTFNAHKGKTYYLTIFDDQWRDKSNPYTLKIEYPIKNVGTPPKMNSVPDWTVSAATNVSRSFSQYVVKTDGDKILEYKLMGNLPSGFNFNTSTGVLSGKASVADAGDYNLRIEAKDKDGWSNIENWIFKITYVKNTPPIMNSIDNQNIRINQNFTLSLYDYVTKTDGDKILKYHLNGTLPDGLEFNENSGNITGTPNNSTQINQKFYLTAWATDKDGDSNKESFTIYIKPKGTDVNQGDLPFYIVNSIESRNIRGNYLLLGNTVECHTHHKNELLNHLSANKYCEDMYYGNNGHLTNYIDIDNDSKTWNSTSSNFTVPNNSKILWAGLFWQGNLNNRSERHYGEWWKVQRHAEPNDSNNIHNGWHWVYNNGSYFNIEDTAVNKVLIKVDRGAYQQVIANTLSADNIYYGGSHAGGPYAAYADITDIVKQKNIISGKHTVTVANIIATQGMDGNWLGDYGGWSMVVVYENKNESIKNISIFNGFTIVKNPHKTNPPKHIKISGFKLPKHNRVEGYLGVFSGEGEYNNHGDTMKLEGNLMPGITYENQYNVFDEISFGGLDRDSTPFYNNLKYADTIDIDKYDVSDIMTELRDNNPNINSVDIEVATHQGPSGEFDAFFPSMFAFSTQLYVPKVCYDYDLKLDEYIDIENNNRNFKVSKVGDDPLKVKIMLKSQEADFNLIDAKMKLKFTPDDVFEYIANASKTSYPNTYEYHNAIDTDSNIGEIAVGSSASKNGGIIAPKDFLYSKMYYKFKKPYFDGKFDIYLDAKVSYDGIHKIPYTLSTAEPDGSIFKINRCEISPIYNPVYGMFNVERGDSRFSQPEDERYSLYTQVVGVPYQVSVASYKKDKNGEYKQAADSSTTVELELIDASTFDNNSSAGYDSICRDPDSFNKGKFVHFHRNSRVYVTVPDDFPKIDGKSTYPENLALRNAAFRIWVLTKNINGVLKVVTNKCDSQIDSKCFDKLYKDNYKNGKFCSSQCTNSSSSECYDCLRKYYATPICSRDNFSIRPESYSISISDNNETHSKKKINIARNSSYSYTNLSAGYLYSLDINATNFADKSRKVDGYYLNVIGDENSKKALVNFSDLSSCYDKKSHNLNINILNGQSIGHETLAQNSNAPRNGFISHNSGKYKLHIQDQEWTLVDQKNYIYKPFKNRADCIKNSTEVYNGKLNTTRGCSIISNYGKGKYYDLYVNMHPYNFVINTLNVNANPNKTAKYIYLNDLNQTKNLIKNSKVMAINLSGKINAVGKDGTILTNYTKGCSAQNTDIKLRYDTLENNKTVTIKDILNNNIEPEYTLFVQGIDTDVDINKSNSMPLAINFNKKYFDDKNKTDNGKGIFNAYFNFKREYNGAVNPFTIYFSDFDLKSSLDKSTVDLNKNHIPTAHKDLNSTIIVYYAKAKSQSDFYDDIVDKSVATPIMVTLFCNKSLEYCEKYNIDTKKSITSEYDWWISRSHSALEGEVELKTNDSNKAIVSPSTVNVFTSGVNKNVKVKDVGITLKPYTVYVSPTDNMKKDYPWLLFNKFKNVAPKYLYKVRFVDISNAWSGKGKTGHIINDINASGRKSRKIDW